MPIKVKIVFSLIAIVAVVSLFQLATSAHLFSPAKNTAPLTNATIQALYLDDDNDGLNNIEESYWNTDFQDPDTDKDGYLDGEEVSSGHDPSKAGPDDSLTEQNLTKKFAELTLAGLYEGSLKPSNPAYVPAIDAITAAVTDDLQRSQYVKIDDTRLHMVAPSTLAQEKYVQSVGEIIKEFLPVFVESLSNGSKLDPSMSTPADNDIIAYFKEAQGTMAALITRMYRVEIPENWQTNHRNALQLLMSAHNGIQAFALSESDPVRYYAGISSLQLTSNTLPVVIRSFANQIANDGLSSGTIFRSLLTK